MKTEYPPTMFLNGKTTPSVGLNKYLNCATLSPTAIPIYERKRAEFFFINEKEIGRGEGTPEEIQLEVENFTKNQVTNYGAIPINLPFKTILIETNYAFFSAETNSGERGFNNLKVFSILCQEIAPCSYRYICTGLTNTNHFYIQELKPPTGDEKADVGILACEEILRVIFNSQKNYFHEEKCQQTIKIKKRQGAEYHTVRRVIHVTIGKTSKSVQSLYGGPIDWQHSWSVRGHWRKCATIGKDREGNYSSPGFTWVKDHQKGSGPFIPKTRVMHQ